MTSRILKPLLPWAAAFAAIVVLYLSLHALVAPFFAWFFIGQFQALGLFNPHLVSAVSILLALGMAALFFQLVPIKEIPPFPAIKWSVIILLVATCIAQTAMGLATWNHNFSADGKSRVWYSERQDGSIHFFHRDGVDPVTGLKLIQITPKNWPQLEKKIEVYRKSKKGWFGKSEKSKQQTSRTDRKIESLQTKIRNLEASSIINAVENSRTRQEQPAIRETSYPAVFTYNSAERPPNNYRINTSGYSYTNGYPYTRTGSARQNGAGEEPVIVDFVNGRPVYKGRLVK